MFRDTFEAKGPISAARDRGVKLASSERSPKSPAHRPEPYRTLSQSTTHPKPMASAPLLQYSIPIDALLPTLILSLGWTPRPLPNDAKGVLLLNGHTRARTVASII